ncbi:AIPR family protein [Rossellomorea marisflavi]|uniref:AIPR family protein n=1 Tax=Rossellomorea marisflavi TaxID=189381 RepID=UPI003FA01BAC
MSQELFIPVKGFRKLPAPVEGIEVESFECYVQVKNLPGVEQIPFDTNPRDQHMDSAIVKQIEETLQDTNNNLFHILNKGITLSVNQVEYDNQKELMHLTFEDTTIHGNIDGGHTFKLLETNKSHSSAREKFVKFEIIRGLDESNFASVAEARNTAAKVESYAIAELNNQFDIIKDVFRDNPIYRRITFKQFEDKNDKGKTIPVRKFLAVLNLFNIDKYNEDNHPKTSYTQNSAPVKYYLDYMKNLPLEENPFYKMQPIMIDIINLHAEIEREFKDAYNENGGNYKGLKFAKVPQPQKVRFSEDEEEYINFSVPDGILLPVLASLRALVIEKEGKYKWSSDPYNYLDDLLPKMAIIINDKLKQTSMNPNSVGKDASLWLTLYMVVERKLMKEFFKK